MKFHTRKLVKPTDLNARGTLFGGQLLKWIDEEAAIFAICQANSSHLVTKAISEINFIAPVHTGDIVEFGCELIKTGNTSLTISMVVRNKTTKRKIVNIDSITFVNVDRFGAPKPLEL